MRVILRAELDPRDVAHAASARRRSSRLMTMSPNCSGVVSRPCVWTLSSKPEPPLRERRRADAPAATWTFCARSAATISLDVQVARGGPIGIDPDAHRIVAGAEDADAADALQARSSRSRICSVA